MGKGGDGFDGYELSKSNSDNSGDFYIIVLIVYKWCTNHIFLIEQIKIESPQMTYLRAF